MNTNTKTNEADVNKVQRHVESVNRALESVRRGNRKLFDAIYAAANELNTNEWDEFVAAIDCDKSTINKVKAIAKCPFIRENFNKLPVAWSVLHAIAVTVKKNKEDEQILLEALKKGELTRGTSLDALRKLLGSDPAEQSEEPVIRINSSKFNEVQNEFIARIRPEAEAVGIAITDSAKRSSESNSNNEPASTSESTKTAYDEVKGEQIKEAA